MTTVIDGVYVLQKKIGSGGMGAVYLAEVDLARFDYATLFAYTQVQAPTHTERRQKAEQLAGELRGKNLDLATVRTILEAQHIPIPGRQVAVKVATGTVDLARFEGEWKNLLCLDHKHVVQVYGGGVYQQRPYYAMQLLEGIVSPQRIKNEFSIGQKLALLVQAGSGLQYLHDNGLVHRDIKPDNMVTCETMPGEFLTRITDLGLVKNLDGDLGLTQSNTVLGSPYYMSPEQVVSSKDVDHRADIYSLGASLYEFATGVRPYHDKTSVYQIISAVSTGERPIAPQRHVGNLPAVVVGIIECAMEREQDFRYQSVAEMCADIEAYLAEEATELTVSTTFAQGGKDRSRARVGANRYVFEKLRQKKAQCKVPTRASAARMAVAKGARKSVVGGSGLWKWWVAGAVLPAVIVVTALVVFPAAKDSVVTPPTAALPAAKDPVVTPPTAAAAPVSQPAAVHSGGSIGAVVKPAWASALGQDSYGTWVDLQVSGQTQRFRWIQPGTFTMGSPPAEKDAAIEGRGKPEQVTSEVPHQVSVTQGFWLADSECSQAFWKAITGSNPSQFTESPENPVEKVSWDECQGFVAKLNERVPGAAFRLPSEAQWEYACRAGTTTAFFFGAAINSEQVNFQGSISFAGSKSGVSRRKTMQVRELPANAWGLHHIHGNVWEWCNDRFAILPKGAEIDPTGPASGTHRVRKGGGFTSRPAMCRSAARERWASDFRYEDMGFRLAAPATP